jgi:small subunit ribosomal protein S4
MGRYRGPSCKICRRNGVKLMLKGTRCHTAKCEMEKRAFPPGHNGHNFGRKLSEYGKRLREKQKLRFFYGVTENATRRYYALAAKQKGMTGSNLLTLFERRIDNVVYRSGLAASRKEARQLVRHAHFNFLKNGREFKVTIPSLLVSPNDQITVRPKSLELFKPRLEACAEKALPTWLNLNIKSATISVSQLPLREEIDVPVEEQLIVEFYAQ